MAALLVLSGFAWVSCGDDVETNPTGASSTGGQGQSASGPGTATGSGGAGASATASSGPGGAGGAGMCATGPMDPGWICGGDAVSGSGGGATCTTFCNDSKGNQAQVECSGTTCTCAYTSGLTCVCQIAAPGCGTPCCPPPTG